MNDMQERGSRRPVPTAFLAPRPQGPAPLAAPRPVALQAAMAPAGHGGNGLALGAAAPADRDLTQS
jgi:hypothetical protein